ncbi:integral membrane protein [Catellatospora sp. IY07-71]|uniref:DoxX family protein n=1 Tax=Catellatospora sp. IY07-71 TaxID=2728827 RepID=UPI001BB43310|nr:DoxX family protein [Catellatospora sp. IY07-71]BCJ75543.1 integral membrane protein [Catellatospora sp. IY07-71]
MSSARSAALTLALFRVVTGLLFAFHGASSLFGWFGGNRGSGQAVEFAAWPGWWAALIQLAGGLLVIAGLGARPAALLCSGSMAYAYFVVHQEIALLPLNNGGETAALFCWSFLIIAVLGPGAFALDNLLRRRPAEARQALATAS